MREVFEKELQAYGSFAKHELESADESQSGRIHRDVLVLAKKIADAEHTGTHVQAEEIYPLQHHKQEIMAQLETQLHALDVSIETPIREPQTKTVLQKNGELLVLFKGEQVRLTPGDLITGEEWGERFFPDPHSVPRAIQKKFYVHQARTRIQDLVDLQLAINDQQSKNIDGAKRHAYSKIEDARKSPEQQLGLIAEKMVRVLLTKFSIDCPGLDFDVVRADAEQDVEEKIDFVIHVKNKARGVAVEPQEHANKNLGVQFTTNPTREALQLKRDQLAIVKAKTMTGEITDIDDIVLISLPVSSFASAYRYWKKAGTPGGPDRFLSQDTKEQIFRNVLQGIFSSEAISEQWEHIQSTYHSLTKAPEA